MKKKQKMALRFSALVLSLSLCLLSSNFGVISSQKDDHDSTIKTMEEFSGYQINEPHFHDSLSSLSVDTETLQKQVLSRII